MNQKKSFKYVLMFVTVFLLQAEAILQQVGYPAFITNTTALEEYFSGVIIEMS